MRLNIALFWVEAAFYRTGNITVGFRPDHLNATEFTARVEKITDGVLVVQTIYLDYEVMVGAKPNQDWFITTYYPRFLSTVASAGFIPTSMYWVYRSLNFLKDQQLLPLPKRIDFSCYINRNTSTYANLTNHILNDADAS